MREEPVYYVCWPAEPGVWIDIVPQRLLASAAGPAEHLMVESEDGPSALASCLLTRNNHNDVSLEYGKSEGLVPGSLRIWREGDQPRAEWRNPKGNKPKWQPTISTSPRWAGSAPRRMPKLLKNRKVDVRPEQPKFRNRALRVFSRRCAITGLGCVEALEAAHIWTYPKDRDNTDGNCLLLRRDLHALFDKNLLGLEPDGTVRFANREVELEYGAAGDVPWRWGAGTPAPYREAIETRWNEFLEAQALAARRA